jgi:hypothetical protein
MTSATKAIDAHAQDFVAKDNMILPILKASHSTLAHCTLLDMLPIFSPCGSRTVCRCHQ